MALAELLSELQAAGARGSTVATLNDSALAARINAAASRGGVLPDDFLIQAVRTFENDATDEEWHALFWVAAKSASPGTASFRCMIERALIDALQPAIPNTKRSTRKIGRSHRMA